MNKQQLGYNFNSFPEEIKSKIKEKKEYERRLSDALEKVREVALGNEYYTKVHFKQIEKRILDKILDTEIEIKNIIKQHMADIHTQRQGTLFDD